MPLFLTDDERRQIEQQRHRDPMGRFYGALVQRVEYRAASPGLCDRETTCDWWHVAAEYLTDAAMVCALLPSANVEAWLRDVTLAIARRPERDWIGPPYRERTTPPIGHLETAHLSWAVSSVLDLAGDIFADDEREELRAVLRNRAIPLCLGWFEVNRHLANWRCVMTAGVAVAAAVLDDRPSVERAVEEFRLCGEIFQPDGSYAESMQYGNYAASALTVAYEALVRYDASLAERLPLAPYARLIHWFAASHLYCKPLSGWGDKPIARAVNFNDSAAIFRPSGDLLLHVAARAAREMPTEAGLARWLFDTHYLAHPEQGPFDRMSFGFVNHFGMLTLPLLTQAAEAITPQEAGISTLQTFGNGDVIVRNTQPARTVLAIRGGGDLLHGPGHVHGDLNSFILTHNDERLLVDPGHSCYRNLIHELEGSTLTHNTCTFATDEQREKLRQEELLLPRVLQQERRAMRSFAPDGTLEPPFDRGARRLLATREGSLTVVGSEAAALYGPPLEQFARFWLMVGPHVLFVVDSIRAARPIRTTWNWLLNNRDGKLNVCWQSDQITARRGQAAMRLVHVGDAALHGPVFGYVHDAYHPLPGQQGEGHPGSGWLFRWHEREPQTTRLTAHAIVLDTPAALDDWRVERTAESIRVIDPRGAALAQLRLDAENEIGIAIPPENRAFHFPSFPSSSLPGQSPLSLRERGRG